MRSSQSLNYSRICQHFWELEGSLQCSFHDIHKLTETKLYSGRCYIFTLHWLCSLDSSNGPGSSHIPSKPMLNIIYGGRSVEWKQFFYFSHRLCCQSYMSWHMTLDLNFSCSTIQFPSMTAFSARLSPLSISIHSFINPINWVIKE
jgi:hypothetical protein